MYVAYTQGCSFIRVALLSELYVRIRSASSLVYLPVADVTSSIRPVNWQVATSSFPTSEPETPVTQHGEDGLNLFSLEGCQSVLLVSSLRFPWRDITNTTYSLLLSTPNLINQVFIYVNPFFLLSSATNTKHRLKRRP
jgi:hypothetical protein